MNLLSWALIGGALAAAGAAIDAGRNLAVALPAGALAVLLIAIVGVAEIRSRTSPLTPEGAEPGPSPRHERVEGDSLLRLRRAFKSGQIGRASILAALHALEQDLGAGGPAPLSLEDERRALDLSPEEFRQWIDGRLRSIEVNS